MRTLPDCHSRVPMPDVADRFWCRHPQVHVSDNVVCREICHFCNRWQQPAPLNLRSLPQPVATAVPRQHPIPLAGSVLRGNKTLPQPWEQHNVTVAIPCLDTSEILELAVRAWQWQYPRPYLLIIDTGSTAQGTESLWGKLRATEGIELATLGIYSAVEHLSDRVAIAMDYAFARCPTEFLLATHVDVFPKHQRVIERLLALCSAVCPVVGWEMSFRGTIQRDAFLDLSAGYPGHACTMFHIPTMDRIGAGWSMRRAHHAFGLPRQRTEINGWPDTEVCLGRLLQKHGLEPRFLGRETNDENQETEDWVHSRSTTVHANGDSGLLARHRLAMKDAAARIRQWEFQGLADADATIPYWQTLGEQPELPTNRDRRRVGPSPDVTNVLEL